jgi:hypothetical protein
MILLGMTMGGGITLSAGKSAADGQPRWLQNKVQTPPSAKKLFFKFFCAILCFLPNKTPQERIKQFFLTLINFLGVDCY